MSFILDALRKSDQQRQRSVTPTLMTAQAPAAGAKQPALFWYGLLAIMLLGAGMLIGWLHQWQAEPATPAIQASADKSVERNMQQFAPPPSPSAALRETVRKPGVQAPLRQQPAATPAAPAPVVAATTPPESPAPAKPVSPSPAAAPVPAAPAPAAAPKQEERVVANPAARNPGVLTMAELPAQIQQELPKLSILAHSYSSKPKARFVFINDQMVHEEEFPAPGLKLEQITPDGMIFSYKGYQFRRAANQ